MFEKYKINLISNIKRYTKTHYISLKYLILEDLGVLNYFLNYLSLNEYFK